MSGWLARTTASIAFCCVSTSGSRSTSQSSAEVDVAAEAGQRGEHRLADELVGVLELRLQRLRRRPGRLKRARMLMMWVRAIGSLPSSRLSSSGTRLSSAMSATTRNRAAFSAGSWL